MTMTYDEIWHQITTVYDENEAKAIARYVLDVCFGMSATDVYCGKVTQLSADDTCKLEKIIQRIIKCEPVQYITGTADFAGHAFDVEPGVLIPRPETAELCEWIIDNANQQPKILDIGTGSGCIAITLALGIDKAEVHAWDISAQALRISAQNASRLGVDIAIERQDAIRHPNDNECWDIIVSNPPYVCDKEKADMEKNVLEYEPELALFVPDDDPLIFYQHISKYAIEALKHNGMLYFEINPIFYTEMIDMLEEEGFYDIKIKEDMFGKKRFVKAKKL